MARKQDSLAVGYAIVLAVLAAPFVWAHSVAGWLGVVGLVACLVAAFMLWVWVAQWLQRPATPPVAPPQKQWTPEPYTADYDLPTESWQARVERLSPQSKPVQQEHGFQSAGVFASKVADPPQSWQDTYNKGPAEIDRLVTMGDWNSARVALQRIAYGMLDAPPDLKTQFTQAMCKFAVRDPLYQQVMQTAVPIITQLPGITQAKLYAGMSDDKKELMRYVLYYAAEMGQIVRQKKGNSYALYPQGFVPPTAPAKPARKKNT